MPRIKILFIGEGVTLAHIARPLSLCQALDSQRYEISFACGGTWRHFVKSQGILPCALPTMPPEEFVQRLALGKPLYTRERLLEYVRAELELFKRISPDLVIGDFRISLGISTEIAQIPYVALANAYWSPFSTFKFPVPEHPCVKIFGIRIAQAIFPYLYPLIFQFHVRDFNKVRREYSQNPVQSLQEMYTLGTWTLYVDLPCLIPTTHLPSHHSFLGPVLWEPTVPFPPWWKKIKDQKPLAYITLGSSGETRILKPL